MPLAQEPNKVTAPLCWTLQVAVRRSLSERAASGARVHHLEHFTAEGKPVVDPKDSQLWLSVESKHTLLEFDFA